MKSSCYLYTALVVIIVTLTFHKIYDPDVWMHIAVGDYIRETHSIPRTNTFSFTHPGHEWLDTYWLYQIALSLLWQWGHAAAITSFRLVVVLALAGVLLFGFRRPSRPLFPGEGAVFLFAWLLLVPRLTDRPELMSYLIFAALLTSVRHKLWWSCVALQLVWANVHGFFFWGPITVGLFATSEWLAGRRQTAQAATFATLAMIAVSTISPFGWRNWLVPLKGISTIRTLAGEVEELLSPFHPVARATDGSAWLLVLFIALAALIFALNWRLIPSFDWFIITASLPLALVVRRSIPLFVLCALPALLSVTPRLDRTSARIAVIGLCSILAISWPVRGREFGVGVAASNCPHGAVEFVEQHLSLPVRLFNAGFATGGYLAAHHLPVFVDGRLEAYPTGFLQDYLRATEDDNVFRRMAQEYGVTHALVVTTSAEMSAFAQRLAARPEWSLLYSDETAVVLARRP